MDRQFFTDLKNNDVGLLENALPMITGAVAEPVAGIAAMYHAATGGHDASGVVNAIRDAMTYQPRTDAGKMYQQALGSAVNRIVQSAPVRTWQKGVDIAGQYSPTAGAVLQTVPAAIGAATGVKPALRAGRAMSGALDRVESFAPSGSGAVMGMQKGMIDPSILKSGDPVRDMKFGDAYEYIGVDPSNPANAIVQEGKSRFSVNMNRIEAISKREANPSITNNDQVMELYHGSAEDSPSLLVKKYNPSGGFDYGAVFGSSRSNAAGSHGPALYRTEIPTASVLEGGAAAYSMPKGKINTALSETIDSLGGNKKAAEAFDAIVMDADVGNDGLRNIFGDGYGSHEYGLLQQKARAAFAKKLGYRAVTSKDEHGTSYMILPGEALNRVYGAATGVKPALRAGRAMSGALDRVESFAPSKTGGAGGGGQVGAIMFRGGSPTGGGGMTWVTPDLSHAEDYARYHGGDVHQVEHTPSSVFDAGRDVNELTPRQFAIKALQGKVKTGELSPVDAMKMVDDYTSKMGQQSDKITTLWDNKQKRMETSRMLRNAGYDTLGLEENGSKTFAILHD